MIGIYKITNPIGEIYIGQSKDLDKRKLFYSKLKCKSQRRLYNSIKSHGWINHSFEVIEYCNLNELNEKEIFYINTHNCISPNGLNLKHGGNIGVISPETKQRMSDSHLGSKNYMYGKTHTKEARDIISKTHKGRKLSTAHIEFIKSINRGRVKSKEEIEKLRQSKIGKLRPQSVKDKVSKANSKPFAISNNSFYMEFDSVTKACEFMNCSRKEVSNKTKYKEFNLMYL